MTPTLPTDRAPLAELAPFSQVRLIAIDIDGTLVTKQDQQIADLLRISVNSLKHYGVTVTVATGRAVQGALTTLQGIDERMGPAITYNGAITADVGNGVVLSRKLISSDSARRVYEVAKRIDATVWSYDCASGDLIGGGAQQIDEKVTAWLRPGEDSDAKESHDINGLQLNWVSEATAPTQCVAILLSKPAGGLEKALASLSVVEGITATSSTDRFIEVRPDGVTKATALEELIRRRRIDRESVLTIGDNHNDVEMLAWSGISVAVANATETAKAAATFVAHETHASGVIETLRLVVSAKRFARGSVFRTLPLGDHGH